jgi:hypothetical protein
MADAFSQAGAVKNPTRYAAATMGGEQFTGLWTQRSPYRDAASAYLVKKFYAGSRFDSIIDGLNREINTALEDQRSPGSFVWNANDFPAALSFYSWKYNQNSAEVVRVLLDGLDGNIYDASNGGKSTLLTKTGGPVNPAKFLGVNTQLYIGDGSDQKKVIGTSKIWKATTKYYAGDLIADSNGNLQQAFLAPLSLGILQVQYIVATEPDGAIDYYVQLVLNGPMNFNTQGGTGTNFEVQLSGLTTATFLNGAVITGVVPVGDTGTILLGRTGVVNADYGPAPDTGTAAGFTNQNGAVSGYLGISGGMQPAWATGTQALTTDGGLIWQCYGSPVKAWGVTAPSLAPGVAPAYHTENYWQANTIYPEWAAILDANGQLQLATSTGSSNATGFIQPTWNTQIGGGTPDSAIAWTNAGTGGSWYGTSIFTLWQTILDTNGNLQVVVGFTGSTGTSGTAAPTWSTTLGAGTTDGNLTWICCGPAIVLRSASLQFSFSWHSIDGTVSTAAPLNKTVVNGILGTANGFGLYVSGPNPASDGGLTADEISQIDQVWIWATAQGQPTLINLATIPVEQAAGNWSYLYAQDDTALVAEIPAPVADSADPPPVGFRPCCYAFQRVWGVLDNTVVYSQGPDAVTGNGNTQFSALNTQPFLGTCYAVFPVTVQNGGLLVWTSSGIQIILGTGTQTNPFYATTYYANVSVTGYNAVTQFNTNFFVLESNLKVSTVAVEYPFNPATGYTEIGLPIGDQFQKLTTGGYNASLFQAAFSYISWNTQNTEENALYVADGSTGWFRLSAVSPPETGYMWAPYRAIAGGTSAVMAVETSPGVTELLMAPFKPRIGSGNGPILARDATGTVWTDNGAPYPSYDTKGVMLLCATGSWAEVAHISTKSKAVGARPTISVLLNEIEALPAQGVAYSVLEVTSNDPPNSKPSKSVYSDRYDLEQNGVDTNGDALLVRFDYGTQAVGDCLLDFGIYATVHDEREEAAQR